MENGDKKAVERKEPFNGGLVSGSGELELRQAESPNTGEVFPGTHYTFVQAQAGESFADTKKRVEESARIVKLDVGNCHVDLWGKWQLSLDLTFSEFDIQPMFSGACWAGTVVWPASLLLCELMREDLTLGPDSRVIELGAGLGVPGMAAKLLGAGTVFITEQEPLPSLLNTNMSKNVSLFQSELPVIKEFDWEEPPADLTSAPFDFILVSDCVYEELYGDSWKALADCILRLSKPGRTVTYNSIERRNKDGVEEFLSYCEQIGISFQVVRALTGPLNETLLIYRMWVPE